jgi:predicted amidophosphoribosyltransferase
MKKFTIKQNEFLKVEIEGYAHGEYQAGMNRHYYKGNIENVICTLKNDKRQFTNEQLLAASISLSEILKTDLVKIAEHYGLLPITVVTVPRSKASFPKSKMLFSETVKSVVSKLGYPFADGTDCIKRVKDTYTTHKESLDCGGGSGRKPFVGITNDSCEISGSIRGKRVLLVDDVYTFGKNVDEDAIQTLLDKGAASVVFYSVGVII